MANNAVKLEDDSAPRLPPGPGIAHNTNNRVGYSLDELWADRERHSKGRIIRL